MTSLKIAIIVGAGPAGCMLARILSLHDVSVTVYESDSSPNYRLQGGTLDLHPTTGLAGLEDGQLMDEFREKARYDGDYYLMTYKDCKPFFEIKSTEGKGSHARPEIDRYDLRKILTESLPEGTIKWGHKVKQVEDGGVLVFEHGTKSGFDLIVGGDGAWSKVRNYITDIKPRYTGIGYHILDIQNPKEDAPELHKLVNGGNLFSHDEGKKISIQQMGDGSIHVGYASLRPENWMGTCGYDPHDLEQTRKAILEEMADWSPRIREAVEKSNGRCDPKCLYMLPVGWRWEHRKGATIIGDAAHLMTPFGGEGVNLALDDARKLAAAIVRSTRAENAAHELEKEIQAFEEEMWGRMEKYQRFTDEVTKLWMFTQGDVRRAVPDALLCHVKLDMPAVLHPLAYVGMHTWWWLKTTFWDRG